MRLLRESLGALESLAVPSAFGKFLAEAVETL